MQVRPQIAPVTVVTAQHVMVVVPDADVDEAQHVAEKHRHQQQIAQAVAVRLSSPAP
jgi:hypothetical protein